LVVQTTTDFELISQTPAQSIGPDRKV